MQCMSLSFWQCRRLMLYLDGHKTRSGDPTMYLCNLGDHSILVKCRFTVLNRLSSQMDKVEGTPVCSWDRWGSYLLAEHTFKVNADRAKRKGKLLETKELEDESLGFVRNGWVTVVTEIVQVRGAHRTTFGMTRKRLQCLTRGMPRVFRRPFRSVCCT